jgi:hypothetical protein
MQSRNADRPRSGWPNVGVTEVTRAGSTARAATRNELDAAHAALEDTEEAVALVGIVASPLRTYSFFAWFKEVFAVIGCAIVF